jgi:glycolate oxidase iron-sulfur subunit
MKTNFTLHQLKDPLIAESDQILRSCQHFGFCTSGCPTYVLLKDERDSPRGRIDLIREMLESGAAVDPETVEHLDKCLSCGSCVTTCAVKVDFPHLIDHARAYIEEKFRRPLGDRLLRHFLAVVLPRRWLFSALLRIAIHMRFAKAVIPRSLSPLFDLAPKRLPPTVGLAETFPATSKRRFRVGLLAGCAQQVLEQSINMATIRLLNRLGCEVIVPSGVGCCGSLELHMGKRKQAQHRAARNLAAWEPYLEGDALDAIIVNASGCGSTVKDYGHLLQGSKQADLAAKIATLCKDVTEWVASIEISVPPGDMRYAVVYHDPCSMRNVQKVVNEPRRLLKNAGFVVVDVPEGHFCCGSAGTYNLLQPEIARQLGTRKAANLQKTRAVIGATGNIGCLTQIRQYTSLPMVHTVELLDWAYGGPVPVMLKARDIQALPPGDDEACNSRDEASAPTTLTRQDGDGNDVGVW